jgi:hypothetical protein
MEPGEVVIVFYEKLEPLQEILEEYSAQPVESLNGFKPTLNAQTGQFRTDPHGVQPPLSSVVDQW